LFSNTAQAAKPTTGLFGATTTQPTTTFGQPAASGGLFGAQTTTPAATTSLFGGQSQQPAPGFGQPQATTSLFGNATTTPAKPAMGLFGAAPAAQPTANFGFGQSQNAGGTSLFGNTAAQASTSLFNQQPAAANQQVLHASLNKNPYGVNPLLQKSLNQKPADQQQPVNHTTPTPEKKLPTLTPTFKVTPRSSTQIKLRGVAPQSTGPSISESHRNQINNKKSLHILDGSPRDVVALGLDSRFTPRRSVKRLDIDDASVFLSTPQKQVQSSNQTPKSVSFRSGVEEDLEVVLTKKPKSPSKGYVLSPTIEELMVMSDEELRHVKNFTISIPVYGSVSFLRPVDLLSVSPTKTRAGISSIAGEIVVIDTQTVTVYPDESFKPPQGQGLNVPAVISLLSCWPRDRVTNDIIDNESDPRFDKHMKKLATMEDTTFINFEIIRGLWKFRVEHFTRYGLVDDSDEDEEISGQVVPSKVDESEVMDDTFMLGNRDTSILKGVVGELLDESEPEEFEEVSSDSEELDSILSGSGNESEESASEEVTPSKPNYVIEETGASSAEDDEDLAPVPEILQSAMSTVDRVVIARNVQTMKASLFQSPKKLVESPKPPLSFSFKEELNVHDDSKAPGEKRTLDQVAPTEVANRTEFSSLQIIKNGSPKKYIKQNDLIVQKVDLRKPVPLKESTSFGNEKLFADASFHMGRSFRVCFSPNGTIVIPKSISTVKVVNVEAILESQNNPIRCSIILESVLANTKVFFTSPSIEDPRDEVQVDPVEEVFADNQTVISSTVQLSTSQSFSRCPKSVLNPNFNFDMICQGMSAVFSEDEVQTWKLARDLWDRIPLDHTIMNYTPEQFQLIEIALRRTRVSQWLKGAVESTVTSELAKAGKVGIDKVFLNLTGNRVANSIEECFKNSDFRLACILSQLPSPIAVSTPGGLICPSGIPGRQGMDRNTLNDLVHQINYWDESKTAKLVDRKYLAVWTLLSGAVQKWDESIFQPGMDWKRTFGLFFWYSDGGNLSLASSIAQYAGNLDSVTNPLSRYNPKLYDLAYHLLQLSSNPEQSLEEALDPLTHTKSPLDYRISWTMGMILTKISNVKQFKDVMLDSVFGDDIEEADSRSATQDTQALHFISQLLAAGSWKWAIFVSTFLSFHTSREGTIREILNRYYPLDDCSGSVEKDEEFENDSEDYQFLTRKLYINPQWIHESRVIIALV
jgi:nuclear pore complex protein Nup98-Nup96